MDNGKLFIGCAGWAIPIQSKMYFPQKGSHLERYARRFGAVEINSSFYRPHRPNTYSRWAQTVGDDFQFAVKMPRVITHDSKLRADPELVRRFIAESDHLGKKLGCLLVQFPPSLRWEPKAGAHFFEMLRRQIVVPIACEPRHESWFTKEAEDVLEDFQISRVAADPSVLSDGQIPGGWTSFDYYRLHGSPRIYYSSYGLEYLRNLSVQIRKHLLAGHTVWCIFDNTAEGAASQNGLQLLEMIQGSP